MPRPPRALLVDVGGTLLREAPYDLAAGVAALRPGGGGTGLRAELEAEIARVHETNDAAFTLRHWLERNRSAFAREGDAATLERVLWAEAARLSPLPGAAEAVRSLAKSALAVACVSNAVFSGEVLAAELARHGFGGSLRFVLSSADVGVRKPAPAIFAHALDALGVAAEEAWYVGDSWAKDVRGAAAAGLLPVWLSESEPPEAGPSHLRADSWTRVRELVAQSLGARRTVPW